jgi:hypothetical protein
MTSLDATPGELYSAGMRAIAFTLAISVTGCSFAFVSGPPANHRQLPAFSCSESRVVPVLDTIWTVLQTSNLILAAAESDQKWSDLYNGNPPISRGAAIPLYAVLAGLGAAGMYYGYTRTSECREAKDEAAGRAMQPMPNSAAPGTWPPPGAAPAPVAPPATDPAPAAP